MRVDAFDFHLPPDRIAQRPVSPRDAARLLHVASDTVHDRCVLDLPSLLRAGDLLVFNDTRVIPARLQGERRGIGISVTLHQQLAPDCWKAFAKPAKRLKPGDTIVFASDFSAEVLAKEAEGDVVLLFDRGGEALRAGLSQYGTIPLPPYIRAGVADEQDRTDYQTLFARAEGAVAAPTAALHFTPSLMTDLAERGVQTVCLTLHVGAGTFLPVKAEDTTEHKMHGEWGVIASETAALINEARAAGGRIVAVGTTSLRLLETAAREDGTVDAFEGSTEIFITPGYRFKAIDLLLTNFHLPRSTLFMLVSAFAGLERMHAAYAHAIKAEYRFYSYGDCCLIEPENGQ